METCWEFYLQELLQAKKREDFVLESVCPNCLGKGSELGKCGAAIYCCNDCFVPDLVCKAFVLSRH